MASDIHLFVEVWNGAQWTAADQWQVEPYRGQTTYELSSAPFYKERNYCLFAILANVRNGYTAGGIDTGEGFVPISMPKGLPDDASPEVRGHAAQKSERASDHSWLTVSELIAYNWTQTTMQRGWVNGPTYLDWSRTDQTEAPSLRAAALLVPNIERISETEMISRITLIKKEAKTLMGSSWMEKAREMVEERMEHVYCQASWSIPYYKTVRLFWSDTMPRLVSLGKPDEVRIVFWFDN